MLLDVYRAYTVPYFGNESWRQAGDLTGPHCSASPVVSRHILPFSATVCLIREFFLTSFPSANDVSIHSVLKPPFCIVINLHLGYIHFRPPIQIRGSTGDRLERRNGIPRKALRRVPNLRLDSWKSIAAYLQRGIRTVQRWHNSFGMPVHHFGGTKGCVFAYSDDLDRWLFESRDLAGGRAAQEHTVGASKASSRHSTASADAMWELRSEKNVTAITSLYRDAIDEDPENSAALVGLARSLIAGALMGVIDGFVAYPSAAEALRRVPRNGSDDSDSQCAAAWLKTAYERRWREARGSFERILAAKPQDSYALAGRALLYIAEDKLPEAFHCAWEAWSESPLVVPLSFLPSWIQYLNQDYDDALELLASARGSGVYGAIHAGVEALTLTQFPKGGSDLGRIQELAAAFPQSPVVEGVLGYRYATAGHPGKAWQMLSRLMQLGSRKRRDSSYLLALLLLGLGEEREAVSSLENSFAEGSLWSLGFRSDPILQSLRGERSFEALLHKIGPSANDSHPLADFSSAGRAAVKMDESVGSNTAGGPTENLPSLFSS